MNQSLGVVTALQNFVASGNSNNGVVQMTAYTGVLGGLKLRQGPAMSWKISGGSKVADFVGNFKEHVDAKALNVTGSIVLKDGTLGATTSAGFNTRAGIDPGDVRQTSTGKHFASFSTDAVGSGTMNYSDGTTGRIAFYVIIS